MDTISSSSLASIFMRDCACLTIILWPCANLVGARKKDEKEEYWCVLREGFLSGVCDPVEGQCARVYV